MRADPLPQLVSALDEDLHALRDHDLLRVLTTIDEIRGATVRIGNRWLVSWCANDYLGLSTHPQVIRAACEAAAHWGIGARASRLLAGSTRLHAELEARLAAFFHAESAVVFSSGYAANLGALSALLTRGDLVLVDRLAHASLIDACRASRATFRVFRHNDPDHAAALLARAPLARRRVVVTEGVFSMDGDPAPLARLLDAVQAHGALLYIDDAHGAFVTGATGRGSPEGAGLRHASMIYMGALGKALGCQGGFVTGPLPLIRTLHNRARTFIYSTALAIPVTAAALEALRLAAEDPAPRQRLDQHRRSLHSRLERLASVQPQAPSHIVPVIVGSSRRAQELASSLRERGMLAPAIRPPTVPDGTARLRLSLSALHTERQLDQLVSALQELL